MDDNHLLLQANHLEANRSDAIREKKGMRKYPSGFGQLPPPSSTCPSLTLPSPTSSIHSSTQYAQSLASDGFEDSWTDMEMESTLASSETCSESGYSDKCSSSCYSGLGGRREVLNSELCLSTKSDDGEDLNGNITLNRKHIDLTSERYSVLTYEQVLRLNEVMEEVVPIHGRGNFPTLDIRLKDLVQVVRSKLEPDGVDVWDIRLNGGAASYVLSPQNATYNDLDLIFCVDLSNSRNFDRVRSAVLDSLLDFLPSGVNRKRISSCSLKEAYLHKMVKVTDGDRWSLISLSNQRGRNVELKFVDVMKRQFEFSVDSFQIILDSLIQFYECAEEGDLNMSENCYPTVVGESVFGDFRLALLHLERKLISTRNPEEIRGGGLLKYCNLLARGYRATKEATMKILERYMCSRFFIDFSELPQQRVKLENYLTNHFVGDDQGKYEYLMILYKVVDESTVCLMGHERRQTLNLIEELAYHFYYRDQQNYLAKHQYDAHPYQLLPSCQPVINNSQAPFTTAAIGHHHHHHFHHHHLHHSQQQQQQQQGIVSQSSSDPSTGVASVSLVQTGGPPVPVHPVHHHHPSSLAPTPTCPDNPNGTTTTGPTTTTTTYLYTAYQPGAPYFSPNGGTSCFTTCHCGTWMTCA